MSSIFLGYNWPPGHSGYTYDPPKEPPEIIPPEDYSIYSKNQHIIYINNVVGNIISGIAKYIRRDLMPRAKETIVSTNSKAIEVLRNRKRLAGEKWTPKFPFLVVDPNLNIEPDPITGRFWQNYPNFYGNFSSKINDTVIYDDGNVRITPIINRYRSTIDITAWCSNVYEAIDFSIYVQQQFGGMGRIIYPTYIDALIIIPDELKDFNYKNYYTGEEYNIDWDNDDNTDYILIRNINRSKLCFPVSVRPNLTLVSISNDSDKFGGVGDVLGDHAVTFTIEWECNIPVHINLQSDQLPKSIYNLEIANIISVMGFIDPITTKDILYPKEMHVHTASKQLEKAEQLNLVFDEMFTYILTTENIYSIQDNEHIEITIDKDISDIRYIRIYGPYGFLQAEIHYKIEDNKIILYGPPMKKLEVDDNLYIIVYKDESNEI